MPARGPWRILLPSLADVFFAVLLIAVFVQPDGVRGMLADGDTGWHIRTGELVLRGGRAPRVDPFSFTRGGQAWFAWEWLSDAIFARLYGWRGLVAVAVFAGALLVLASTLLFIRLLRRGCGLWIALAATLAAASASSAHYLARPHVFSILFYTAALWAINQDRRRRSGWLWALVPLTALWANLHAGFVAWLGTLAVLAAVCAWERDRAGLRRYSLLGALCGLASLINPYGWRLHQHVAQYLGSSWILDHVQEFQSPAIRSEGMIVFALLLLAAVAAAPRGDRFEALLVLVWGFAALRSARHVTMFAIAAAPVVASEASALWTKGVFHDLGRELGAAPRVSLWLPAAAAIALAVAPAAGFPEQHFPVAAVERNRARIAPDGGAPRLLTSDQWADYVIFRLYPRQKVFFDGRSDFFGPALGGEYRQLLAADRGWRQVLGRYRFELALLPHDWPLATALEREPGWRKRYEDAVAVLYEHVGQVSGLPGGRGQVGACPTEVNDAF